MLPNSSQSSPLTQRAMIDNEINISLANGRPNFYQRYTPDFSKKFRDMFHRSTKNKPLNIEKEMNNLSKTLIMANETTETLVDVPKRSHSEDLCLFSESPHYIVRIAGTGNVEEFERMVRDDPSKLKVANPAGLCAAHNAAARNRIAILALIAQYKGDLNIEDKDGWTPLHHAVRNNAIKSMEFLLDNGVDDSRLTKQRDAPVHIAVIHNQLKALEFLLSKRPEHVNLPGERGKTPLHCAALIDNVDAAKILTNHNARLCHKDDVGNYPIHVAALNSSNRVFNHLFEIAKSLGYKTDTLLNFCDAENHRPLHSSVIGGNIEAVETCLRIGGKIDDQQDDLSTPVHLAASQGSIEILKLMFNSQSELRSRVVRMTDVQGMTPLHKAAMGDHVDVIEYLLETGADIDARDILKRTPLLVAALKSSVEAVCFLLSQNASLSYRDDADRNLLHFTIIQNLPIETIGKVLFTRENYRSLFDQRDTDGFYPIHYASREGQVNVLTTLISHGAEINKKTNQRQSSLHFAAEFGRYNTCRQLLDTSGFKRILNEPDKSGYTPLHLCCQNGHTRVVQLLLHKGAQFTKSYEGNSPLHEAAAHGHVSTVNTILQAHAHLINSANRLGMTPLHLAAAAGYVDCVDLLVSKSAQFLTNTDGETFVDLAISRKQKDVCLTLIAHDRWKEALDLKSTKYQTPLLGLIEHLPECVPVLFDRCITHSHDDRKHKEFHLVYDFHYINWMDTKKIDGKEYRYPMLPLNMMVKFGRTNHLSHPLCETLLRQKWLSFGFPIYILNLSFYLFFLVLLSYFIITFPACNHHDRTNSISHEQFCSKTTFTSFNNSATNVQIACIWYIVLYCFLNFILEIVQLTQDGYEYFSDMENYVQWTLYITTCVFTLPFLFDQSWHYQWVAGAISIFTAYLALLFQLGRFDIYGIYVIMFLEIMKTLLHVLSLFSILIFGFALTFCVTRPFSQDLDPSNPQQFFMIVLKTITMMLGELDYERSYLDNAHDQHFNITNLIVLLLFAIIMPILLMNLLVGLAIGDLMQIQQNARLKRLATQVQLHTNLEKKLPDKLIQRWTKNEIIVYLNKGVCTRASTILKHWIAKPVNTHDVLEASDESGTESALFVELYKQKRRQKDMQRQLEKITDLIRLVVQKMDIHTEAEGDETKSGKHENFMKMQRIRQTLNAARRFSRAPSSNGSIPHLFEHPEKA
ncbi:unnamed protein product [Adineta steineri]|uniref:Transient receptor potential cation channel subfamily A member 1 n=1 Tax=Adineta steineri TaxID=433720 RepID=A0A819EAU5_9BILA|nr:unnamed protein product [Adineta steineri]CAF3847643.1 unnamed protein product [Adineta steineri]